MSPSLIPGKFRHGKVKVIGPVSQLPDFQNYVNMKYNGSTYEEIYNASNSKEIPVLITSFNPGGATFIIDRSKIDDSWGGNLSIANNFGGLQINDGGDSKGGLRLYTFSLSNSNNMTLQTGGVQGGTFTATLVPYLTYDGNTAAIRQVDDPYGQYPYQKASDYYSSPFLKSKSFTDVNVKIDYELITYNSNQGSGMSDSESTNLYYQPKALGSTSGEVTPEDIEKIYESAGDAFATIFSQTSAIMNAEVPVCVGVYAHYNLESLAGAISNTDEFNKFKSPSKFGNKQLKLLFDNGNSYSVNYSDFAGDNFSGTLSGEYSRMLELNNDPVFGGKTPLVPLQPKPGVIDFCKTYGMIDHIDGDDYIKGVEDIGSDAKNLRYTDAQMLLGMSLVINQGSYYKKAASLVESSGVGNDLGPFFGMFSFVTFAVGAVLQSSIATTWRLFRSIGSISQSAMESIKPDIENLLAPYKLEMRHWLTYDMRKGPGQYGSGGFNYLYAPELWGEDVNVDNISYDSFAGLVQKVRVELIEPETDHKNDYGGTQEMELSSGSFYTKGAKLPLYAGCTYHILPGHVWLHDSSGKHVVEQFKVFD